MSKRLKRLITGVNDVCFLSYLATFLLFLSPLGYLFAAAKGQTATQILHGSIKHWQESPDFNQAGNALSLIFRKAFMFVQTLIFSILFHSYLVHVQSHH